MTIVGYDAAADRSCRRGKDGAGRARLDHDGENADRQAVDPVHAVGSRHRQPLLVTFALDADADVVLIDVVPDEAADRPTQRILADIDPRREAQRNAGIHLDLHGARELT